MKFLLLQKAGFDPQNQYVAKSGALLVDACRTALLQERADEI